MRIISQIVDWVTTPYTIYLILKDPTIRRSVKIRSIVGLVLIFAYIVSPLDIIPDFIPFSGWLDDLIIVPTGLAIIRKITPGINVVEKRKWAQVRVRKIILWMVFSIFIAILLGFLWIGLIVYIFVRLITG